jgi:hypothetical protein
MHDESRRMKFLIDAQLSCLLLAPKSCAFLNAAEIHENRVDERHGASGKFIEDNMLDVKKWRYNPGYLEERQGPDGHAEFSLRANTEIVSHAESR